MAENIIESLKEERTRIRDFKTLPAGLRFLSFVFIFNIVITLVVLIFSSRDLVAYSTSNYFDWINLVFEAVLLWMIWYRYRAARTFTLIFTSLNIVVGTAVHVMMGDLDAGLQLASIIPDLIIFSYFYLSPAVKETLVNEISFEKPDEQEEDPVAKRWSWPFVRNLIMYFCVFSFLGHWMEMGFCLAIRAGLVAGEYDPSNTMLWRDWFYPFPMHGMAVVLIGLALYPLWRWLVHKTNLIVGSLISFVVNGLACGAIEFCFGLLWNADLQNWNYSNMPFNFMGQVCLQNVVGFAFAASLIAWVVYPWLEHTLGRLPRNAVNIAFVVTLTVFLVAQTLYLVTPPTDYRAELQWMLEQDDLNPDYLTEEERASIEEDLAYLDYLDAYKTEQAERLERERAEQAASKG